MKLKWNIFQKKVEDLLVLGAFSVVGLSECVQEQACGFCNLNTVHEVQCDEPKVGDIFVTHSQDLYYQALKQVYKICQCFFIKDVSY